MVWGQLDKTEDFGVKFCWLNSFQVVFLTSITGERTARTSLQKTATNSCILGNCPFIPLIMVRVAFLPYARKWLRVTIASCNLCLCLCLARWLRRLAHYSEARRGLSSTSIWWSYGQDVWASGSIQAMASLCCFQPLLAKTTRPYDHCRGRWDPLLASD